MDMEHATWIVSEAEDFMTALALGKVDPDKLVRTAANAAADLGKVRLMLARLRV